VGVGCPVLVGKKAQDVDDHKILEKTCLNISPGYLAWAEVVESSAHRLLWL